MPEVETNRRGQSYLRLPFGQVRLDRVRLVLDAMEGSGRMPSGMQGIPWEQVPSRCAASALCRAGYLSRTKEGCVIRNRDGLDRLKELLGNTENPGGD